MLFFVLTWEKWIPNIELVQDTSETPHVNRRVVRNAEHNFGRTVESRLDVSVYFLVLKAATAEVNDLDAGFVDLAQENVLRL